VARPRLPAGRCRRTGKKFQSVGIVAAKRGEEIIAPLQYKGTMDSLFFETWFEERLLPALAKNTTIIMDNATFHLPVRQAGRVFTAVFSRI